MGSTEEMNRAFKSLALKFQQHNPQVSLWRLLPCLETDVPCHLAMVGMTDDTLLKLLNLPLKINLNNGVYRDNIRLISRFVNQVVLFILMVRGIPYRTGKVDEVLVDCELYGLCRYVIESFPWVFMLPNETEESVPLANALVVALFLLQRSCDDVLQRIRRKKAIQIGDEESRSTWFDDLIELVKWPFYRPDDKEFPVEVWRKGTILTLRDNYNSGIYLSLYPRMDCLRGTLMTQHLNQVIEQSSTLRKKFTRGIIAREVFKILGLTKPAFAVDHGSLAIRSPGVENGQLKPDVWKVGVKQRDIILNATKSKTGSVGNTSVDSLDSSNQSMGPIR